jgi:hypothetical protein
MAIVPFPGVIDVLAKAGWQREFNFVVKMPDIGPSATSISEQKVPASPGLLVGVHCQAFSFGNYNVGSINKIRYGAFRKGFVGALDIKEASAVFLQPFPDIISDYFSKWKALMVNHRGLFYPKNNYKKDIYVIELDRSSIPGAIFKLSGCFPLTFPDRKLGQEERVAQFEVTFNVDSVEDLEEEKINSILGGS